MRFLVGIFIACLWASSAFAQAGVVVNYRNSGNQATEVSPSNPLPVSGSFSASLAPFQPSASGARGTPLSVTTSDSSGSLPTGAAVVVSNAGANLMYCNVNAVAATTSDQPITANDGWFVFTIPSGVTTLHCIATGGSTTANTVGGTGLPAGTGGGSGGGGSVTAAQGAQGSTGSPWYFDLPSATPASSNLGQVLAGPPNLTYQATWGSVCSYSSGNNAWCGDPKGAAWLDLGAINAVVVAVGAGATGTGSQRTTTAQDPTTVAGSAPVKGGIATVNGGSFYQAVAASSTATVLQSSTGAAGDYLSHCVIYPTSTSPGVVTVFDNTNTAANSAILFPGGASSISNLVPFPIPVGAVSVNGAWKVTTGLNVSVVCYGKFS